MVIGSVTALPLQQLLLCSPVAGSYKESFFWGDDATRVCTCTVHTNARECALCTHCAHTRAHCAHTVHRVRVRACARTRARTHANTHSHTHTHAHAHARTLTQVTRLPWC
jgi:hypothetical protein